jgi:hypothetical protein
MTQNSLNNKLYAYAYGPADSEWVVVIDCATNEITARFDEIKNPSPFHLPIWNSIQNRTYVYEYPESWIGVIRDEIPSVEENKASRLFSTELSIDSNPLSNLIKISYEINAASNVTIKVYDVTGKLVTTLCNEFKFSGEYKLTWDGTAKFGKRVGSGIYFLSLKTKDKTITKKSSFHTNSLVGRFRE